MKLKLLILLFFLFTNPIHIRVLLMELDQGAISIKQQNNLQIHKLNSSKIAILPELIIKFIDNNLYLNDKIYIYKQPLIIRPLKDNIIDVGGVEYNGYIRVFVDDNKLKIINYLDLEDYVSSVLKTEGWPGWPLRFFEIQAIISRTYALNKIYNNRKNKLYDICNTNLHQTYQGSHQNENINKAVEATKGLFLAYNNKPIDAMFDSCCGGVNPAEISSIPHKKLPYLARNSDCNYCKKTKIANWSFSISKSDFINKIKNKFPYLKKITNILITEKDKAGIVKKIKIFDHKKTFILTGQQLYSIFKEIKSFIFNINQDKDNIIISGKGYGHHKGLCQWGAHEMIKQNKTCSDVINFYYPGAKIKKIA